MIKNVQNKFWKVENSFFFIFEEKKLEEVDCLEEEKKWEREVCHSDQMSEASQAPKVTIFVQFSKVAVT